MLHLHIFKKLLRIQIAFTTFALNSILLPGQSATPINFNTAIQHGDIACRKGNFTIALMKYFAAEAFDPSQKEFIRRKINLIFEKIDKQRIEAENKKKKLMLALGISDSLKVATLKAGKDILCQKQLSDKILFETAKSKLATVQVLNKVKSIIQHLSFYEYRFALVARKPDKYFYESKFLFIDNNGNKVSKLGEWAEAKSFSEFGYAEVALKHEYFPSDSLAMSGYGLLFNPNINEPRIIRKTYLLDTFGNAYPVSFSHTEIADDTRALLMNTNKSTLFPDTLSAHEQLEVIIINSTQREPGKKIIIPRKISNLKNLKTLALVGCGITILPEELGDLQNLTILNLSNNNLDSIPCYKNILSHLIALNLSNNRFARTPSSIINLTQLIDLDLSMNNLTSLPMELSHLKQLKKLNVKGNKIPKSQIEELQTQLPNCKITF